MWIKFRKCIVLPMLIDNWTMPVEMIFVRVRFTTMWTKTIPDSNIGFVVIVPMCSSCDTLEDSGFFVPKFAEHAAHNKMIHFANLTMVSPILIKTTNPGFS